MNIWSQHPFFLLYHSNDIKVSKKRGFACLSLGGLEGEQEVGGAGFSSSLTAEAYWLLWNLYVNAKVRLSFVINLGSAHWRLCSHGESVTGPPTSPLGWGWWCRVPGDLQSAIIPPFETSH